MKKFVVALFLLALLFLTLGAKPKPADPAAYEIAVTIQPVDDSDYQLLPYHWRNAFRCTATVSDVATGAEQASASTVVQPGRRGTEIETVNGLTVLFGVEIDQNREGAVTEVVLKRGDQLLLRQRSTTRFAPMQRYFRRR
jgi:hypothetical protein